MSKVLNLSHEPNVRDVRVAETASNVAIWTGQTHRDNLRTKKRGNSGDFSNCLTVSNCLVLAPVHSCTDIIPGTDAKRNQRTTRVFSNRLTLSNCLVRDPAHSCSATIPGTDANRNQRTTRVFSNCLTVSNCLVLAPVHSCTDNIPGTDAKRNQRTTGVFSNRLTVSNCLAPAPYFHTGLESITHHQPKCLASVAHRRGDILELGTANL